MSQKKHRTIQSLILLGAAIVVTAGCDGNKLADGLPEDISCVSCHGFPPAEPHVQLTQCVICHPDTVNGDGTLVEGGEFHSNGTADYVSIHPEGFANPVEHGTAFIASGATACSECHGADLGGGIASVSCESCHPGFRQDCTFCHGGTDNQTGAPPEDVEGNTSTDALGVGAHTSHVNGDGSWHLAMDCADCHEIPGDALTEGHINGDAALTFGDFSTGDGELVPEWDSGSCSNVYCHGGTLGGGTVPSPTWTEVGQGQVACGSCHGTPPPVPHAASDQCENCHGEMIGAGMVFKDPSLHIDGKVDVAGYHDAGWVSPDQHGAELNSKGPGGCKECHGDDLEGGISGVSCNQCHSGFKNNCTFCHGGVDNDTGAPPEDVAGYSPVSNIGVGAHTVHVETGSDWHADFSCSECHKVPQDAWSAGHIDGGSAELTWGELTSSGHDTPQWTGTMGVP